MKRTLLMKMLAGIFIISIRANAQYCVPTTAIPYNSNMPGITHVMLNTIDRTSLDLENFPQNSYVNTGLSTVLQKGQTYSISITTTIDAQICPDMNIRVWIDYNQDFDLGDVGETAVSLDHVLPGEHTTTFTVPATAMGGPTRMRVTSKMTDLGGHSLPTPCDDPADLWGYHGEIEDYTVEITGTTSLGEAPSSVSDWSLSIAGDQASLIYDNTEGREISLTLYNLLGEKIFETEKNVLSPGETRHHFSLNGSAYKPGMIVLAVMNVEGRVESKKVMTGN
jgi:hypothetical protein